MALGKIERELLPCVPVFLKNPDGECIDEFVGKDHGVSIAGGECGVNRPVINRLIF